MKATLSSQNILFCKKKTSFIIVSFCMHYFSLSYICTDSALWIVCYIPPFIYSLYKIFSAKRCEAHVMRFPPAILILYYVSGVNYSSSKYDTLIPTLVKFLVFLFNYCSPYGWMYLVF